MDAPGAVWQRGAAGLKNAFLEIWCSFFIRYGHKKHPIKSFPLGRGVVRIASS
jgi:hypothetical protein